VETDPQLVVVDLATAWTIETVAFLVVGLGFLVWSMAVRNPWESLALFAVEAAVILAFDRWLSMLHHADKLNDASPLPAGARRGSALRYLLVCIAVVAVFAAILTGFAVAFSTQNLAGGWLTALGIVRAVSVLRVRDMQRRGRVEYRLRTGASRRRIQRYYFASPAF